MFQRVNITAGQSPTRFIEGVAGAFAYLNYRERWWAALLFGSAIVNAVLGLIGLTSILPFFQLLVQPDPLATTTVLGRTLRAVGIYSESEAIALVGVGVVSLVVVKNVYSLLHTRLVNRFTARTETQITTDVLRRIVHAPFNWYLRRNSSVLRDVVVSHVIVWSREVIRPTLLLANNCLILLCSVAVLLPFTPVAAIALACVGGIISAGIVAVCRPRILLTAGRKQRSILLAGMAATEAINAGRDVRMSRAGKLLVSEFHRAWSIYAHSDVDSRQWQSVPRLAIEIIGITVIVGIAVGLILSGMDRMEVATVLMLYAVLAMRLIPIVGDTANGISVIQMALPLLGQLRTVMDELPNVAPDAKTKGIFIGWQTIALHEVSFRYTDDAPLAVNGIDLSVKRGRSYGLVGSSGAGKSTLADIISGLLSPTAGTFSVDGRAIKDDDGWHEWRSQVSYVSQHPVIFDTRLADNITLGTEAHTDRDGRLDMAIAIAGLRDVIAELPDGVETQIGDRGARLSGGQRQRVAIARAVYRGTDLMILDEATSALDSLTERDVTEAIDKLKGRLTLVIIAHRLSTVMHCDEIVVLEKGRIVARGSHDALLASSPIYRSFVQAQALANSQVIQGL